MKQKRLAIILTTLVLLASLLATATAFASEMTENTDSLANWTYQINEDGTVTIVDYSGDEINVVVPDTIEGFPVTVIGDWAFCERKKMESVVLPDTITAIQGAAFYDCVSLRDISIPESVTEIGWGAFYGCFELTAVTLPSGITEIKSETFSDCIKLANIVIPDGVTKIGWQAFCGCDMESITIPDSVKEISGYAFLGCDKLESVTLPSGITSIASKVFSRCEKLTSIAIPDSVTSIESYAFSDCKSLTTITIPNSVTSIGRAAFSSCESLTSVVIPEGVIQIGEEAFYGCSALTGVILPQGLEHIGDYAFSDCSNLKVIYISLSTTVIGMDAFCDCENLQYVYYAGTEEQWEAIDFSYYNPFLLNAERTYSYQIDGPCAHVATEVEGKAATCTETGLAEGSKCALCDEILIEQLTIPALGHGFGHWVIVNQPAQDIPGEKKRICGKCGEQETAIVENPFPDVMMGKYYSSPVLWAAENGITKGTKDGNFSLDQDCTRKQIVMFLWRAAGEPEPQSMECSFTDVRADSFQKAILWAVEKGITNGTSTTEFSPERACTRKQIVTFLYRYFGEPALTGEQMANPFSDVKQDQFENAILWAYYNGVTTGRTETTFEPESTCTRGQIVTFLYRSMVE